MATSMCGTSMQRGLVMGVMLSLCAHGAAVLILTLPTDSSAKLGEFESKLQIDEQDARVRLGIQRSNAVTVNWIGFEAPTEHAAEKSTVEQAALSPEIGGEVVAAATPADVPDVVEPAEGERSTEMAEASPAAPVTEQTETEPLASIMDMVSTQEDSPVQVPMTPPVVPASEPEVALEAPQSEPEASRAPSEASAEGSTGERDPRESDAASLTRSLEYRPGRPLAAEGLEITTVRPRYSVTTRTLARPRDPHITIEFDSRGRVRRAHFATIEGRVSSTGHEHVDGPLLDAIYRWRAEGQAIKDLKDDQTVSITIRVILGAQQ